MMQASMATLAQMSGNYDGHMDWGDGWTWVMVVVMVVVVLAIVGGIIWAIVFTSKSAKPTGTLAGTGGPPTGPSARELLDLRYARGEIDTEEYTERRSALG